MGLSVLARGSLPERLQWAFNLYDVNGDGIITKDEMVDIVSAIYDMMGRYTQPVVDEYSAREHAERVFQVWKICYRNSICLFRKIQIFISENRYIK